MKKRWTLGLVLALAIVQGSSGPRAIAAQPLSKSTVQIVTSSTEAFLFAPLYVALTKGYFRQEGLDVKIFGGGGGPNAVAALIGGGADMGAIGIGNISHAIQHGQHLVLLADVLNNIPFVIVVRKQLATEAGITASSTFGQRAAVLQHLTVGCAAVGGGSGLFAQYALSEAHLDPHAVTLINMDNNPAQLASLKGSKIDGFVNTSPTTDQAVAEGYGFPLIAGSDIPSIRGVAFVALTAPDSFVKEHPDTVRAVLIALRKAIELEARSPKDAEQAFYDYWVRLGGKQAVPENLRHAAWVNNQNAYPTSLVITPSAVDRARAILGIPSSVTSEQMLSMDLARKVMGEKL